MTREEQLSLETSLVDYLVESIEGHMVKTGGLWGTHHKRIHDAIWARIERELRNRNLGWVWARIKKEYNR